MEESPDESPVENNREKETTQVGYEDDYDSQKTWGLVEDNLNASNTESPLGGNPEETEQIEDEESEALILENDVEEFRDMNYVQGSSQSISNPFGEDDEEEEEVKAVTLPNVKADTDDDIDPFGVEEIVQHLVTATDSNIVNNLNPFGDDDIVDEEIHVTKTIMKQSEQPAHNISKKTMKSVSFNPFDDGGIEDENIKGGLAEAIKHQQKVIESPTTSIASILNKTRNKTQSIMKSDTSSMSCSVGYDKLVLLGFDKVCVKNALVKTSGDEEAARKMLTTTDEM
jgi:hypothetical protein